jgi:predicted transglutaminase-like cysteine proteinase
VATPNPNEIAHLTAAAKTLQDNRTGLVLTGRITNGKLILDKATEQEIATKFAQADVAFVAMNSPFDPNSQIVQ